MCSCVCFQLDAPLFITLSQCVISIVICVLLGFIGDSIPAAGTFPPARIDISVAMKVSEFKSHLIVLTSHHSMQSNNLRTKILL